MNRRTVYLEPGTEICGRQVTVPVEIMPGVIRDVPIIELEFDGKKYQITKARGCEAEAIDMEDQSLVLLVTKPWEGAVLAAVLEGKALKEDPCEDMVKKSDVFTKREFFGILAFVGMSLMLCGMAVVCMCLKVRN